MVLPLQPALRDTYKIAVLYYNLHIGRLRYRLKLATVKSFRHQHGVSPVNYDDVCLVH